MGKISVLTLIQYLEELTDAERVITVPADEVERLVHRFGDRVRAMGRWNAGSDGSLQIPESVIRQAAMQFQNHVLVEAVGELKAERLGQILQSSAASSFIEAVADAYRLYFRNLMTRYQNSDDPRETNQLRDQLAEVRHQRA